MNGAFSSGERRHLEEPEDWNFCDRLGCTNEAMPGGILCARHEDDLYDYRSNDA